MRGPGRLRLFSRAAAAGAADPPGENLLKAQRENQASRPKTMTRETFERHVAEALAMIPTRFRKAMRNIAIVVDDEPAPALLREMKISPPGTLFGLYQGVPLPERRW